MIMVVFYCKYSVGDLSADVNLPPIPSPPFHSLFGSEIGFGIIFKSPTFDEDGYQVPSQFIIGDKVWPHLVKQCLKGQRHHKLQALPHGQYIIIQYVGHNAFKLDLPTQLVIHPIIDLNNIKLHEPSQLEEDVPLSDHTHNILDFQCPLDIH